MDTYNVPIDLDTELQKGSVPDEVSKWRFAVMGKADKRRYKILRGKGAEPLPKSARVFDVSVKVAV